MTKNDIRRIWLTSDAVWIEDTIGRQACEKFADYASLSQASEQMRQEFIVSFYGIHWPAIDEDLSFDGFFAT